MSDQYASVLRNARTGRTLVVRRNMTRDHQHALVTADLVPHVGAGGGALTPSGPIFGPVWFMSAGPSKSYVRPMTTLPSASAPTGSSTPPQHLLGQSRPGQGESEPTLQPAEDEELQDTASDTAVRPHPLLLPLRGLHSWARVLQGLFLRACPFGCSAMRQPRCRRFRPRRGSTPGTSTTNARSTAATAGALGTKWIGALGRRRYLPLPTSGTQHLQMQQR